MLIGLAVDLTVFILNDLLLDRETFITFYVVDILFKYYCRRSLHDSFSDIVLRKYEFCFGGGIRVK
ncbi:unnamed protein product [Brugia timori]|uniref:Uncharacterized protein n=1 Tax=Brugia timori TaxID=42155 RepID=A0A0R3Q3T4_9BILA|nr:unnamed protein product [Brugia timori]